MSVTTGQVVMMHNNLYYWKNITAFELINDGIIDFNQTLNPNNDTKQYIADKNERNTTTGYNPNFAYGGEIVKGDAFCEYLYEVGKMQKVGKQIEVVEVDEWKDAVAGSYPARQYTFEVQPGNPGSGSGGTTLQIDGTLQQLGDVIEGTFDPATKEFTATA